jgi:ribosome-binding protein aMBF1 (putative translation factor)
MSNKTKLEQIFGEIRQSKWNEAARQRNEKRQWLHYSQEIALAVMEQLDLQNITQKGLAERMNVSPQLVNKWLKGSENFTLETISKLESVLAIRLMHIELKVEKLTTSKQSAVNVSSKITEDISFEYE